MRQNKRFNMDNTTVGFRFFTFFNYCFLTVLSLSMVMPLIYVLNNSLRPELEIVAHGYTLVPERLSSITFDAYRILLQNGSALVRGFGVTVFVTVAGTLIAMVASTMFAYAVAHREVPLSKGILLFAFIGGYIPSGLIAWYLQMRNLGLLNTYWVMVLPDVLVLYNVLLMKTYFQEGTFIALEESAKLDGANDMQILTRVVLPVSKPILATIGLFYSVAFWNSWYTAALCVADPKKYPVQLVLNQIITSQQFQALLNRFNPRTSSIYAMQMAAIILVTIPIVLAYPFVQKYFVKGIMVGVIKE